MNESLIEELVTRLGNVRIATEIDGITHYWSAEGDGSFTTNPREALVCSHEWAQGFIAGACFDSCYIDKVD